MVAVRGLEGAGVGRYRDAGGFGSYSSFSPQSLINSQYQMSTTMPFGMPASGTTFTVQGAYVGFDGTQVAGEYLLTGESVPDSCP